MPATAQIRSYHSSGSGTPSGDVTGTTLRFRRSDADTQDTSNPVPRPGSGENLSWAKYLKMNWTTTPTGSITNLRVFPSTRPPTGINLYMKSIAAYTQPATGNTSGISSFTTSDLLKATYQSSAVSASSPVVINGGTVLSNPSTGEGTQNFLLLQAGVLSSYAGTVPGVATAFTLTYRYQET